MKIKKIDTNILPYLVAVAQGLQIGHAGYVYVNLFGAILGGILGVAVTFSVAQAASRINDTAKKRKALAYFGLVVLLLASPLMVAPAAYMSFDMPIEILRIMVAIVWALAPDACMVLSGAIAGKSLVQQEQAHEVAVRSQKTQVQQEKRAILQNCDLCGMQYRSKGAHMRQHHPEKCTRRAIPVEINK